MAGDRPRATVVGAAGFVGRRLTHRLRAEGWDVHAPAKGEAWVSEPALGTIFYCAGLTADYDARPYDAVEAHASLLNTLLRNGAFERLVYCSSTRLYDGSEASPAHEDDPLMFDPADPRRTYDLSKALGENLTLTRSGGRGVVARLGNVFDWAPGAPGFLSEWLIAAAASRSLDLASSPHVARDYIHLDDVVSALIALARGGETLVNVASGERVRNDEIARTFQDAGWTVRFRSDADPPPPPAVSIDRLLAVGVRPRAVRDVVADYLKGLAA